MLLIDTQHLLASRLTYQGVVKVYVGNNKVKDYAF